MIYDYEVLTGKGEKLKLADYKGKVILIVNTATGCGFTPQYEPIEKLYKDYHDKGLEILDIPCNQFGAQAPGSDDEIHEFCTLHYNTTFPQMKKSDVNGEKDWGYMIKHKRPLSTGVGSGLFRQKIFEIYTLRRVLLDLKAARLEIEEQRGTFCCNNFCRKEDGLWVTITMTIGRAIGYFQENIQARTNGERSTDTRLDLAAVCLTGGSWRLLYLERWGLLQRYCRVGNGEDGIIGQKNPLHIELLVPPSKSNASLSASPSIADISGKQPNPPPTEPSSSSVRRLPASSIILLASPTFFFFSVFSFIPSSSYIRHAPLKVNFLLV